MTVAPDARPTVLTVEDNALVAMLVEDILAEAGYRSIWLPDGLGPWAAASEPGAEAHGAAVLDLRLAHGLDGRDALRRLRERQSTMPAVVITGLDPLAPESDLRGLGGPTARLHKPFNPDELLERLADVIHGPAAAAPRRRASDTRERGSAREAVDAAA